MSQFNAPAYDLQKPTGKCALTGKELCPGDAYMATLTDVPPPPEVNSAEGATPPPGVKSAQGTPRADSDENSPPAASGLGLERVDVCLEAWAQGKRPDGLFYYWRSTVPEPNQKRRLFVDDQVLLNLFHRLEDAAEQERLAFRFVLALILMRKKLLKYEGTEKRPDDAGQEQEWWRMVAKGESEWDQKSLVLDPRLNEAKIQQVTEQLGQILEAEL